MNLVLAGVDAPNYTQSPNIFFDEWMRVMDCTEFKVVAAILRQTFGWHKDRDRISLSQLETWTGLSRQGVVDGIAAALKRGVIDREPSGNSFTYALIVNSVDQAPDDRSNELTTDSQLSRPEIVNSVDTQKKVNKPKEKDSSADALVVVPDDWLSMSVTRIKKAVKSGLIPELDWPKLLEREQAKNKPRKTLVSFLNRKINPKERPRNENFDLVAERLFNAPPGSDEVYEVATRVSDAIAALRSVKATVSEFKAACNYYDDKGLSMPRKKCTVITMINDYRASLAAPNPNGSTMTPDEKAAAIAAADAAMSAKMKARISAAEAAKEKPE